MLAREQARHRPKVFPQWREGLEFLGDVEPDDARIEREDVGSQAAVVAVQKGIGYWRLVEQVLDIKLERQSARSEEHTSELQSLMRTSNAVSCLKKKHQRYM